MSKAITIIDKEYQQWLETLVARYRLCQVRAAVKVNTEQLIYNFLLGRDIVEMHVEERWGEGVIDQLSKDLKKAMPTAEGLSSTNLRYCRRFYLLYSETVEFCPQLGGKIDGNKETLICPQPEGKLLPDLPQHVQSPIFMVPWGHHKLILDKVKGDVNKALYYVHQSIENGWSRSLLLNWIDTGMYERSGKSVTNFATTMPDTSSDLAQELTKDPYNFAFAGVGREYRLQIGHTENFIDLLFYNLRLRCYVVIEVKIGKFTPADIGQIGSYVVAVNHQLREEGKDNPTIGLLICRSKDNTQAKYALESSSQPIGISEYELEQFYPAKVEGTIPTIEEIEAKLNQE